MAFFLHLHPISKFKNYNTTINSVQYVLTLSLSTMSSKIVYILTKHSSLFVYSGIAAVNVVFYYYNCPSFSIGTLGERNQSKTKNGVTECNGNHHK